MAIEVNTWAGLCDSSHQNSEVVWTGGDLNFNEINENGFNNTVKIYGSIDFQGATFRNFRHVGGYLYPNGPLQFVYNDNGYIKNLNFVNAVFNVNNTYYPGLIAFAHGDIYNSSVKHCRFDIDFVASTEINLFRILRRTNYSGETSFKNCSFNIKGQSSASLYLLASTHMYDCNIKYNDVKASIFKELKDYSSFNNGAHNCNSTGKITQTTTTSSIELGSNYSGTNIYRIESAQTANIYSNQGISVYDSDLLPNHGTLTQAIGCDETQLKSASYLNSIGFQIAT